MRYSILKFTLEYHQTVFLSEPPQLIQNCTYRGSRDLINVQLCTNLGVLFRSLVLSFGIGGKLGALDGLQGLRQGARQGSAPRALLWPLSRPGGRASCVDRH